MLKCEELLAIAHFDVAPSFLWFTAIQSIEGEERLADLSPQGCFVAAEAVESVIGQIGKTKKASRQLSVWTRPGRRFKVSGTWAPLI